MLDLTSIFQEASFVSRISSYTCVITPFLIHYLVFFIKKMVPV